LGPYFPVVHFTRLRNFRGRRTSMRRSFFLMALISLSLLRCPAVRAQSQPPQQFTVAPDVPEPGSVEAIAKATGDPRFVSPWVAYLPDSATVPSPVKF